MNERVLLVKLDKPAGGKLRLSFSEPIGLCYIATVLRLNGIDCRLLHLIRSTLKDELFVTLENYKPSIVGFSVRNFNFNETCATIRLLRQRFPNIRTVIGGECITPANAIDLAQKADADLAVINDGELSILAYSQGKDPSSIPGAAYRTCSGEYKLSGKPSIRVNPSQLPMMDRTGLPMDEYTSESFPEKRYASMHTQRGCRYKCTFCHTPTRYKCPLARTAEQVLEEADYLMAKYDTEAIAIFDEDFFSNPIRVSSIAQGLIDRGSPVQWHSFMKLTDLKNSHVQSLLPILRDSNYIRAIIGLESFLPETLQWYHKAGSLDVEDSLRTLSAHNIRICPAYIIGELHETYEDIKNGLTHLLRLRDRGINMDLPYVCFITPFPGTPLYEEYMRQGLLLDDNWDNYDGEHVVVRSACPPEKLLDLRDWFLDQFYTERS